MAFVQQPMTWRETLNSRGSTWNIYLMSPLNRPVY